MLGVVSWPQLQGIFKMENQVILSKETIKQYLVDNRKTLRKYGAKRIGLFGSYVRATATAESDIDFIVELERLTFRDYMGLALFLEDLFERNVDLVTATSIKPRLKPYIVKEIEDVILEVELRDETQSIKTGNLTIRIYIVYLGELNDKSSKNKYGTCPRRWICKTDSRKPRN